MPPRPGTHLPRAHFNDLDRRSNDVLPKLKDSSLLLAVRVLVGDRQVVLPLY